MFSVLCSESGVAEESAMVSGFGFDWLAPESARCVRITDAKKLGVCEFNKTGAFGLSFRYHSCANKGKEILVFQTADQCQEALETMQANAP
jgi:hypothetical protein